MRTFGNRAPRFFSIFFQLRTIAVLLSCVIISRGIATAADRPDVSNPCQIAPQYFDGLSADLSVDIHALDRYKSAVSALLHDGQYEKLDCLADRARTGKERMTGGLWVLHQVYAGLTQAAPSSQHATHEDWQTLLTRLKKYVSARPESITAQVALAQAYISYAWEARGSGYSDSVTNSGWKLFEERTGRAKEILITASRLSGKCPEWYVAMQEVAQNQSWDKDAAKELFEQAHKFEPGYFYNARILANYLQPKWSGEPGDAEAFVTEISNRTGGDEGDALYFQLANFLFCGCGEDNPKLSWPRIVKGFEASEKLYGSSTLNLNLIAYLATYSSPPDPIVANKAFSRLGEQWDEEKWDKQETFNNVKQWAATVAPLQEKHQKAEDAAAANMQSPEGEAYKVAFEKKYKELVRECVGSDGGNVDKFETLTYVGVEGTVEEMGIYWNAPAAACLYKKLLIFQQQKTQAFPKPPSAPYWIRLDLDASEFNSVATR